MKKSKKVEKADKEIKAPKKVAKVAKVIKKVAKKAVEEAPCASRCSSKKEIPHHEIATRAYFIAERRAFFGGHGTPECDWHEAVKQINEES